MTNLLGSLETARQSLNAQRRGLMVTGHNIANVNTPNYARERVDIAIDVRGHSQSGSNVTQVTQVRDKILESRLRQSIQDSNNWSTQSDQMQQIERLFTDLDVGGVSGAVADFWDSWHNLSVDPESKEIARNVTIGRAQDLVQELKNVNLGFQSLYEENNTQIHSFVTEVNELGDSIAKLNRDIAAIEFSGETANSQRTVRHGLLTKLSEYTDFTTIEESNGMLQIHLGGLAFVDGDRVGTLAAKDQPPIFASSEQPNTKSIIYTEINQLVKTIARKNQSILSHRGTTAEVRQIVNERSQHENQIQTLFNLAGIENATISDIGDGTGMIKIEVDGELVLEGTKVFGLPDNGTTSQTSPLANNQKTVVITDSRSGKEVSIKSGKIGGLMNVRDNQIPRFIERVNSFATTLMAEVNSVHVKGYGLDNTTGIEFFTGESINDMAVNLSLVHSPEKIGVSSRPDEPGNNEIAFSITAKRNEFVMSNGTQTLEEYYASTMTIIGIQSQQAQRNEENNGLLTSQLESFRESVSGVSMDEEMVNLIQFQRAYEAAARYISTVDQVMQTLINM
ncbi:hypothetical protein CMK19_14695 [Candidatus Poribacteria bacterium]|nr:hypothetical protein [Candidatus Poribacteria bacterium]